MAFLAVSSCAAPILDLSHTTLMQEEPAGLLSEMFEGESCERLAGILSAFLSPAADVTMREGKLWVQGTSADSDIARTAAGWKKNNNSSPESTHLYPVDATLPSAAAWKELLIDVARVEEKEGRLVVSGTQEELCGLREVMSKVLAIRERQIRLMIE